MPVRIVRALPGCLSVHELEVLLKEAVKSLAVLCFFLAVVGPLVAEVHLDQVPREIALQETGSVRLVLVRVHAIRVDLQITEPASRGEKRKESRKTRFRLISSLHPHVFNFTRVYFFY